MFDNQTDPEKKKKDLKLCKEFVVELFADRKSPFHVLRKPEQVKINWTKYEAQFNDHELAAFRAFARISHHFPAQPFVELFDAYQWDVDMKLFETEEDLITYSILAGGCFGATIVYSIFYRDYNEKYYDLLESDKNDILIKKAYQMGQVSNFSSKIWHFCIIVLNSE